jgi:hypothetical protein
VGSKGVSSVEKEHGVKHPTKEDFEVQVNKRENIVVNFTPTNRHYRFLFLADGSLDAPLVTGGAGDYLASEVDELARASAAALASR